MKKFIISFDIYRNDQWNDFEKVVHGEDKESALAKFKDENRLARNLTITDF